MGIRPYCEGDEASVAALWNLVFGHGSPHNQAGATIQRKLAVQRELFFVARLDDRVVGTVMAGYDGHRGWIHRVAVDLGHRRRGIGSALMRHAEQALKDRGCPKVNLQVHASNAAVVAFYEALGYSVEPRVSLGKLL